MKKIDASSLKKLGIALLFAILLIALAAIAAEGRERDDKKSDAIADADPIATDAERKETNTKNEPEGEENRNNDTPKVVPAFLNALTGEETTEDKTKSQRYCLTVDSAAPLYGLSSSDLCIEIPTENGKTRMLFFPSDLAAIGKAGALAKSRSYLETVAHFFGGIPVFYGKDDLVTSYPSYLCRVAADLSQTGYCYMENARYAFTSGENVLTAAEELNIKETAKDTVLPYLFADYFGDPVRGNTSAESVTLPYAEGSETVLRYNASRGTYTLFKGERVKKDQLNGKDCTFKNVIILFADGVEYSRSSGKEAIVDAISGGSGYYLTEGTASEIRWTTDKSGNLVFSGLNGEDLTVNRGNFYIAYYSSADAYDVTVGS